jgi:diguanylate cyclase (GGDEF)-like protein
VPQRIVEHTTVARRVVATEHQLSAVLAEFAQTMVMDFPLQATLDRLMRRIVAVMPVTAAGITMVEAGGGPPRYVAAAGGDPLRFDTVETTVSEGPCVVVHRTNNAISIPDLRLDDHHPIFAEAATAAGLLAVFTFPLRHGDRALGALDLYRATAGPLAEEPTRTAQVFADVAAAYILNARARQGIGDASARFDERSLHDSLTGLGNRALFAQRVDHAVLRNRRSGRQLAVLFTNLDRFKEVNDRHGHSVGDELLMAVAERLTEALRPDDTLARLNGDEFVILCEDIEDASAVERLARRIDAGMNRPFVLSNNELTVTASVGIAYSGPGTDVPGQMLRDADTAMYQAKRRGGAGHQVLDLREQARTDDRATLRRDLDGVLVRGELTACYQPIVATADGRIVGVEALVRWTHPSRGAIPPALLIPLAEESHAIGDIGCWMLEQACQDVTRWNRRHSEPRRLEVAVNVSPSELLGPDYASKFAAILDDTGTDPCLVTVEVTEDVLIHDPARALVVLHTLKDLGVKVALDDFGTGYSSLSYLREFPVDIVKIDRSFVTSVGEDTDCMTIVSAIIDLAHGLRKTVVAEGTETVTQYRCIAALGGEACQGYYFARPMPADEVDQLLRLGTAGHNVRLPVGPDGLSC